MTTFRLFTLASVAALLPAEDSTRLTGPTSGLLFDAPSRAIRVVMGVPGAAYLGAALASDLDNGSVSPNGRLAVTISAGAASLINVADGPPPLDNTRFSFATGCEGAVAWNADSSAVALNCAEGARLYRIAGGNVERLELAQFAAAKALAVDASGTAVFAASANGIYRIDADSARLLASVENSSSLALAGKTLYAIDRAGKQVVAIENLDASASLRMVVGAGQGLENPLAVGISADGAMLYVAEGGESKSLRVFNARTAEPVARLELDFDPGRVDALGNGLFLLNARKEAADTLHVLDARQLAVYFIPAQDLGSFANLED